MARPTFGEIEEIAQLRKEGDLGGYIRNLGGMKVKPRPEYQSIQCPHCGAPQNQACTGLRGMRLGAGVHESRIRAVSPQEVPTMSGVWPRGLPMEKEKEEMSLTNEQAIRAAALQAAVVAVASMSGGEEDVILMAEEFAAYIRSGPKGFQRDPGAAQSAPSDAWSQAPSGNEFTAEGLAQEFATSGYNAKTKDELGKVWREATEAGVMDVKITLGDGGRQELGSYLTELGKQFRTPPVSDRTTRNDLGL